MALRPRLGVGIANLGNTCFVSAVAQVLLRLAPFRRLLHEHGQNCLLNTETCPVCALAAQAAALSVQGVGVDAVAPLATAARAGLFGQREFTEFNQQGEPKQCDASEFFLAALRAVTEAGYQVPTPHHGARTALQQHVCGIAFRQRRRCDVCRASSDKGVVESYLKVEPSVLLGPRPPRALRSGGFDPARVKACW